MTRPIHPEPSLDGPPSLRPGSGRTDQSLVQALETEAALLSQPELYEQWREQTAANPEESRPPLPDAAADHAYPAKLRDVPVTTAIIQRHHDGHGSLEETLLEIYYANISLHEAQEILHALWGDTVDLTAIHQLSRLVRQRTTGWLERPIPRSYPYVFFDSIQLARRGDGNTKSLCLLLAVGVDARGFRDVLGIAEGAAGPDAAWSPFLRQLKKRGLADVNLCVGGYDSDLIKSVAKYFPDADYQGCITQMYRDVLALVPAPKEYLVIDFLQHIHSSDHRKEAQARTARAATQLQAMGLPDPAALLKRIGKLTFSYFSLPRYQWHRVNTTESLKKYLRAFRERARVLGCIQDGDAAVQLVATRLRSIMRTSWGRRRFINVARSQAARVKNGR